MNKTDIPYAKISEKTGVSVTTISRALTQPRLVKHSTLKEIYRAIEELGGILLTMQVPFHQTSGFLLSSHV